MGFSFSRLGQAPWMVGLWGTGDGDQKLNFPQIQLNLVCELLTCMGHETAFLALDYPSPWGPREGSKGQISLNFSESEDLRWRTIDCFLVFTCIFPEWCLGSGVVLDCIDS